MYRWRFRDRAIFGDASPTSSSCRRREGLQTEISGDPPTYILEVFESDDRSSLLTSALLRNLSHTVVQAKQKGSIGIVLNTGWFVPYSDSNRDQDAAQRAIDFSLGWYVK